MLYTFAGIFDIADFTSSKWLITFLVALNEQEDGAQFLPNQI
jgi:hypothetical protein